MLDRSVIVMAMTAMLPACASREPPAVVMSAAALIDPELIFDRSFEVFDRAVFYKPKEPREVEFDLTLAPLIVQELPQTSETVSPISPYPGSSEYRSSAPSPAPSVVMNRTVSRWGTHDAEGEFHEQDYHVTTFVWRYPSSRKLGKHMVPEARGVRITSTTDGVPLLWQVLDSRGGLSVVYVSSIVEQAAAEQFGPPLPGRRFSVERSLDEASDVVVARVIEDGPVPMGPYVYVAGEDHTITSVLCRCMPSQVNDFVDTRYYELNESIPIIMEASGLFRKLGAISEELNPEYYLVTVDAPILSKLRWPRLPTQRTTTPSAGAFAP